MKQVIMGTLKVEKKWKTLNIFANNKTHSLLCVGTCIDLCRANKTIRQYDFQFSLSSLNRYNFGVSFRVLTWRRDFSGLFLCWLWRSIVPGILKIASYLFAINGSTLTVCLQKLHRLSLKYSKGVKVSWYTNGTKLQREYSTWKLETGSCVILWLR